MAELDWRTVRELMALAARLREMAERALVASSDQPLGHGSAWEPPVDIWESETEVVVDLEIPGATVSNLDLHVEGNTLTLSGELPAPNDEGARYVLVERFRGRFHRSVTLPTAVTGTADAALRGGVLRVRFARKDRPRRTVRVIGEGA
jgi:HSP20 family protein